MADNLREGVAGLGGPNRLSCRSFGGDAGRARPRVGFRQLGQSGKVSHPFPFALTGIRRRRHLTGGEGGFNLAQPPEVRPHLRWEIDERGNRPGVCAFLPGPAQDLPHLAAMSNE